MSTIIHPVWYDLAHPRRKYAMGGRVKLTLYEFPASLRSEWDDFWGDFELEPPVLLARLRFEEVVDKVGCVGLALDWSGNKKSNL